MGRLAWAAVSLVAVVSILLGSFFGVPLVSRGQPESHSPANVGFTFSERQAGYLDVSWQKAFEAAMDLSPDLVRLGAYWDTIEPAPGSYDFADLDWLLDHVPAQSSVLLTVGMKAPRWPEYFLPDWLRRSVNIPAGGDVSQDATVRSATLRFISRVVEHERGRGNITYWQVENEPMDPAGPRHWRIDAGFLAEEIGLVRSLDSRPIVASMFVDTSPLGALPPWHGALEDEARQLLRLADVLGLDVYPVRPIVARRFQLALKWPVWLWEPRLRDLRRLAQSAGKQTWISEAQAEPWLPSRLVTTGSSPSRNAAPNLTASAVERMQADGFHTILLWGVEYWYMRSARYEDAKWWSGMLPFFHDSRSQSGVPGSA